MSIGEGEPESNQ